MICPATTPPSFGLLLRQVRDGLVRQLDASMAEEDLGIGFTHYIGLKVLSHMAPCTANELAQAIDQVPSAGTRHSSAESCARQKLRGDAVMDYALRDLSADERTLLLSLLTRIRDSLTTP